MTISQRTALLGLTGLLIAMIPLTAQAQPVVPGFVVETCADLTAEQANPGTLSIDQETGDIYIGRDGNELGVWRLSSCGAIVEAYGDSSDTDCRPQDHDSVLLDTVGFFIGGEPKSLLFGGVGNLNIVENNAQQSCLNLFDTGFELLSNFVDEPNQAASFSIFSPSMN